MPKTAALLIALAAAQGGTPPSWIQLLPAGEAKPGDARDAWQVTPEEVVLASASRLPFPLDVDHITDLLPKGTPNPAYGWVEELAARGPAGEPGVWGRVEWTDLGVKAVASRAYRYISPVFLHDRATRRVGAIIRASLVNDPALSLKALAAREADTPSLETSMPLKKIAAALGLAAAASEDAILAAIAKTGDDAKALASRLKSVGDAAGVQGDVGDDQVVAICAKLKAPAPSSAADETKFVPIAKFDELQLQLAALQQRVTKTGAEAEVDAAIKGGRLVPAQRDWAIAYASRDPEGFATMIGNQPVILPGGRVAAAGDNGAAGELTADQKAICSGMGIAEEDYKKALAARQKEAA